MDARVIAALIAVGCRPSTGPLFEDPPNAPEPASERVASDAIRAAVDRALNPLVADGVGWIEEHKCSSCHQVPSMLWGMAAAGRAGFAVPSEDLSQWSDWSAEQLATTTDKNVHGIVQTLSAGVVSAERKRPLLELVLAARGTDGTWQPRGQLPDQRRPLAETREVATLWAVYALVRAGAAATRWESSKKLAQEWIASPSKWVSNEHVVMRLRVATALQLPTKAVRDEVLATQNRDGGWGWLRGDSSDALATGQTLSALLESGGEPESAATLRGLAFLVRSQKADGSWDVRSTLAEKSGPVPTSNYWGMAWAVIALSQATPTPVL